MEPARPEGRWGTWQYVGCGCGGLVILVILGGMGANRGELQDFIEGKGSKPTWFQKSDMQLDTRDHIRHGAISASGYQLLYSANRGEVNLDNQKKEGLVTFLLADCPGDDKVRLGIWFGPDIPQPAEPPAYAGTPADPEAIREFAGHFQFCPAAD
jgi:hypothetical protein